MYPEKLNQFRFILASKSPRRQFLLTELGIPFELVTKEVDESFPDHLRKDEIPLFLARKKADAFAGIRGDAKSDLDEKTIVITADTIVWINDHVLNKPENAEEASVMLRELSGNRHEVFTGVCLKSAKKEIAFSVRTVVYFRELTEGEIAYYISTYKPFDKAGAYGAQEFIGYIGVEKIEGSYFNVMGLPVKELYEELVKF
ncbi:MAG: Maf family nucleotide pyrophosphatase [Bacteroidota bacterium]|nr:Maf family nucleotide pyrophosphatase [Bacteroidota bacterium]